MGGSPSDWQGSITFHYNSDGVGTVETSTSASARSGSAAARTASTPTTTAATQSGGSTATAAATRAKAKALYEQGYQAYERQDDKTAFGYYSQAAEMGDAGAQDLLGGWYEHGIAVRKDKSQSDYWYRKAAESYRRDADAGDKQTQRHLGHLYRFGNTGLRIPEDKSQSDYWYRKAAESYRRDADAGDTQAQYVLGWLYQCGNEGLLIDLSQADYWYRKAAEGGHEEAKKALIALYKKPAPSPTYTSTPDEPEERGVGLRDLIKYIPLIPRK
jgi:TPR repeat protein